MLFSINRTRKSLRAVDIARDSVPTVPDGGEPGTVKSYRSDAATHLWPR